MTHSLYGALTCSLLLALAGCSSSYEAQEESAPAEATAPAETAVETAAPEEPAVQLPDGFPEQLAIMDGIDLESAEVIDAAAMGFKIVGGTRADVDAVLDHYERWFKENGWEEDMVMAQPGMTIIGFKKDGLLAVIESKTGGLGSIVTITTGKL